MNDESTRTAVAAFEQDPTFVHPGTAQRPASVGSHAAAGLTRTVALAMAAATIDGPPGLAAEEPLPLRRGEGGNPTSQVVIEAPSNLGQQVRLLRPVVTDEGALLREKEELLRRKHTCGLSTREDRRLEYVVWLIDQIEDPGLAESLDRLEHLAAEYSKLAARVDEDARRVTAAFESETRRRRSSRH